MARSENFRRALLLLISWSAFLASSCQGKYYTSALKDRAKLEAIQCVAIFPFSDLSNSPDGSTVIDGILYSWVNANNKFRSVSRVDIEKVMEEEALGAGRNISQSKSCSMAKRLNAQGVLVGAVTEYGYVKKKGGFSEPRVGFSLNLYDMKDCTLVYSAQIARSASGLENESLSGLSMNSVDVVMKDLAKNIKERALDFKYRCGPGRYAEESRCERGEDGSIDFEKCPEAIPYERFGREAVSIEGDEIIFNERIQFVPGKALILPESHKVLKELIKFLNKNNLRRIRVESFIIINPAVDSSTIELNRAGEVRRFLLKNGIGKTQVDVANFKIKPELIKGGEISKLRIVVIE